VKLRAHLFEEGRPSSRPLAGHFELLGSPEHRAVARQAVRESLVLLKNAHHLLPLSPHAHVLVAGVVGVAQSTSVWSGLNFNRLNTPAAIRAANDRVVATAATL
jgi:beta-glucosidase